MSLENQVKVICFYTLNTPYQQEVIHLQNSCAHLGIPIEIEPIESLGSWEKNVAIKPKFIAEKLKKASTPLLWVDADGVFLQKPDFSLFANIDFSVRFMEIFYEDPRHAINAATIFMRPNKETQTLVQQWVERCEELSSKSGPPAFVDQIALYDVLLQNKKAKVLPLPVSYCKIYDVDSFFINDEQVIIEQRQLSRQIRI